MNYQALWRIASVRSGEERQAAEAMILNGADIETYYPRYAVMCRPHHARRFQTKLLPAFPGYLFVHGDLSDICRQVDRSSHAFDVLRIGAEPVALAPVVIADLRDREKEWLRKPIRIKGALVAGERVKLTQGALMGATGVILEMRDRTARLSIDMRNKIDFRIFAPIESLASVDNLGDVR
jgi:transcription antitermination factor NusG